MPNSTELTNKNTSILPEGELLAQLQELIERAEFKLVEQILDDREPTERTRILSRLTRAEKQELLTHINFEDAADLLHEMPELQAVKLLDQIEPSQAEKMS